MSSAILKAISSRESEFDNSRIFLATPIGPTSPSTSSAKSFALLGSVVGKGSFLFFLAFSAIT
jgi:hypothetical protein